MKIEYFSLLLLVNSEVQTEQWPISLLGTRLWYFSTSRICTYAWLWCHLQYFKDDPLSQLVCLRLLSLLDDVIPDWDLKERRGRKALTKEALANPSKKWGCSSVVVSWASALAEQSEKLAVIR